MLGGLRGILPWESFEIQRAKYGILEQNCIFFCTFLEVSRLSHWNYGGFCLFASKLWITELCNFTLKNTEVSVIFTNGWHHCSSCNDLELVI